MAKSTEPESSSRSVEHPAPGPRTVRPRQRVGGFAWVAFVAGRHLRTRRQERKNTTALLSILGLAVGVMALITVLSVMNALQSQTIESILAFNSFHLRISGLTASRLIENPDRLQDLRRKLPSIQSIIQFADLQALVQGNYGSSEGVRLRAVAPEILALDPELAQALALEQGGFDLAEPDSIVLGAALAEMLNVQAGDHVSVTTLAAGDGLAGPKAVSLLVTGVFRVGYLDYDRYAAFISLDGAKSMVGAPALSLGIKLADRERDWLALAEIGRILVAAKMASHAVLSRELVSWRQANSAIFGALRVEKLVMMFFVGLIFVVVAVNIFYALRRSVVEKTEDIGILRALGAPSWSVRLVFVLEGFGIGLLGAAGGLGLGCLVATHIADLFWALESLINAIRDAILGYRSLGYGGGRISLFYLDRVPSLLVPAEALLVSLVAFVSALAAAAAASRRVSRILPAEILRNE